jgi:hypothetical protein
MQPAISTHAGCHRLPSEVGLKVLFINDSTSSANWGDRAAGFSLKAMVVEAGAKISGIITEEDLDLTQFGEPRRITLPPCMRPHRGGGPAAAAAAACEPISPGARTTRCHTTRWDLS